LEIEFTDNITRTLLDILKPSIEKADEIKMGVAFVKYSGFSLIQDDIMKCLANKGKVEFVVGLDFRITEPKALRAILEMAKCGSNVKLFCFSNPSSDDTPVYHPKIYLLRREDRIVISIGSSNLTSGGLRDNVEVNAIIEARKQDEIVSDLYGIYNRFKFQRHRFEPDFEYIDKYEEAYRIVRKRSVEALKEKSTQDKIAELKEKEKTLPKPKATIGELFGWQRLVYERLPEELFQTSDMYIYEKDFQQFYPENRHIKDKIRQILQQLRDLGLVRHISESRWQRIPGEK
jgi:HKD family nuclease